MGAKGDDDELDRELIRALAHPLRVQILKSLEDGPQSPIQISNRSGKPLGTVSYHMRVLLDCGCVELVNTIPRRGAVEHVYKLTPRGGIGNRAWQDVPKSLRRGLVGGALDGFTTRAVEALQTGAMESREGSGITWLSLMVDERGWKELRQVTKDVEARFHRVAKKSAERLKDPRDGIAVIVAVAAFEKAGEKGKDADG